MNLFGRVSRQNGRHYSNYCFPRYVTVQCKAEFNVERNIGNDDSEISKYDATREERKGKWSAIFPSISPPWKDNRIVSLEGQLTRLSDRGIPYRGTGPEAWIITGVRDQ